MNEERNLAKLTRAFGGAGERPAVAPPSATELGPGEEVMTPFGPCFALTSAHVTVLRFPDRARAEEAVAQAFCLLFGIGPVREGGLRAAGIRTFADLVAHPRYGPEAQRWLAALAGGDLPCLYDGISRRFSASHDLLLHLLAFADPQDLVFLEAVSQVSAQWLCSGHGKTRGYGRGEDRVGASVPRWELCPREGGAKRSD